MRVHGCLTNWRCHSRYTAADSLLSLGATCWKVLVVSRLVEHGWVRFLFCVMATEHAKKRPPRNRMRKKYRETNSWSVWDFGKYARRVETGLFVEMRKEGCYGSLGGKTEPVSHRLCLIPSNTGVYLTEPAQGPPQRIYQREGEEKSLPQSEVRLRFFPFSQPCLPEESHDRVLFVDKWKQSAMSFFAWDGWYVVNNKFNIIEFYYLRISLTSTFKRDWTAFDEQLLVRSLPSSCEESLNTRSPPCEEEQIKLPTTVLTTWGQFILWCRALGGREHRKTSAIARRSCDDPCKMVFAIWILRPRGWIKIHLGETLGSALSSANVEGRFGKGDLFFKKFLFHLPVHSSWLKY